ncbi:MAG: Trehalose transport system permease protein SugB [Pseudomonadota bacterium]
MKNRDAVVKTDPQWFIMGGVVSIVSWLALVPLVFLVWQSFRTPDTVRKPAVWTLQNYWEAYSSPETLVLFLNSVQFAGGTAVLALVIGTALAWMTERTNTPLKPLFYALSIIPLIIPGILFVVSWIMLASPKIGLINLFLQGLFGTDAVYVDIYSMTGMIWVDGLHYAPIAFLLMTAAFRSMDPSLEESAMMSGASMFKIFWNITLKLAWPAVAASFLILFVRSIESFEVPALLGLPVGIQVFTSSIYDAIHSYPSNIGLAAAYAISLLVITMGGIYMQSRMAGQGGKYSTVTGKGFRPRTIDLGRWKYLTLGIFIVYALFVVILPFLVLLWSSLQKFYSVPSAEALKNVSLQAYATVINYPSVGTAVWNSVILSIGSATMVMFLTAIVCWIVLRTKIPGRWILDNVASVPLVLPGLVMGLAIMVCYLTIGGGIYGTLWIMFIAYVTRFMPYGMRYNTTSMVQLHKELEESAAMSGASWFTSFRRIVLPLLKPGLLAGWIYIVIVSVRELSSSILLYSPGTEVISIVIWEMWQNGQYVELSAFGVMLIVTLFTFVMVAQWIGKRFGVKEA